MVTTIAGLLVVQMMVVHMMEVRLQFRRCRRRRRLGRGDLAIAVITTVSARHSHHARIDLLQIVQQP